MRYSEKDFLEDIDSILIDLKDEGFIIEKLRGKIKRGEGRIIQYPYDDLSERCIPYWKQFNDSWIPEMITFTIKRSNHFTPFSISENIKHLISYMKLNSYEVHHMPANQYEQMYFYQIGFKRSIFLKD
jgi:hypothetical protein